MVEIIPESFEEYDSDLKTKAACERYFEKIIEACVDLAFLVIKRRDLEVPENEESSFVILADNQILPDKLSKQLIDFKGMRNILAHKYGKVDDNKVYLTLSEEIERDVREYINKVKNYSEEK
ncbi:DUF86 domain-containing protein [Candidatus Pacearchaeota archaeon]|nr:DUF86 domain-containing protein [Candidatus Pacearchaeota archaeon]